ncbi:MAG: hypothetical protein WA756_11805, partial [Pseudolabrys sp.]
TAASVFGIAYYAMIAPMPRDGAIIFSDLIGKLDASPATSAGAMVVTGFTVSLRSVAVMQSSSIGSMN